MTRQSEDAAERIETVLDREPDYDFTRDEDDDTARRSALRDLLVDLLHAADEWGYDIEQLGSDALDVIADENELDDDAVFIADVSAVIETLADPTNGVDRDPE